MKSSGPELWSERWHQRAESDLHWPFLKACQSYPGCRQRGSHAPKQGEIKRMLQNHQRRREKAAASVSSKLEMKAPALPAHAVPWLPTPAEIRVQPSKSLLRGVATAPVHTKHSVAARLLGGQESRVWMALKPAQDRGRPGPANLSQRALLGLLAPSP